MTEGQRDAAELERRNHELSILNAVVEALNRSVDLEQALSAVLAEVAELLDLEAGWVWLLDEQGEPRLAAAQSLPPALRDAPERMRGGCYCLDSFRRGDLDGAANVNVVACSRLAGEVEGEEALRFHASVPLYAGGGARVGVLNVASPDYRELSRAELRVLHTIGDMLGIAVERARLFARSAELGAIEERARLARDLHDSLAQSLTGVILQLESVDALLESGAPRDHVRRVVARALEVSRESLDDTRRSVRNLRAAPLEHGRLAPALSRLGQQVALTHGLDVHVDVGAGERPLPGEIADALYRMAQECLSNAARHAGARQVTVTLIATSDAVRLRVEDDGCGIDAAAAAAPSAAGGEGAEGGEGGERHYGLVGLEERAQRLGGSLRIESADGGGTRVHVELPLERVEVV